MSQFQLSGLLALLAVAALAALGYRPYLDEFRGVIRRTIAACLFIAIVALAVFLPVTSFGEASGIDPATLGLPVLLLGHVVLALFLLAWWRLRRDVSFGRFLFLSADRLPAKLWEGVRTGLIGWALTLTATGVASALTGSGGHLDAPGDPPPIMVWMAELPLGSKLAIIGAAMTVEEAFFRSFLQARIGLLLSSVMFALAHFSYGLPVMIVGVFTISIIIGRSFARTHDVLPCIVAHGVFDAVQLLVVLPIAVRMWSESSGVVAALCGVP